MYEIGGYFGLEQLVSNEYYRDLVAVNSARNALLYLSMTHNIKKLIIPYLLCDSISYLCDKSHIDYEYYHVSRDFQPIYNNELREGEYLYIVNYYGQVDNNTIIKLKKRYINIIVDNAQSFFQRPVVGVVTIYSCRKFFGVPDGAYLSSVPKLDHLQIDVSKDRMKHILGRYEGNATDYYNDFKANEDSFYECDLKYMSRLTHNLLGAIDYNLIKKRREKNYSQLENELKHNNPLYIHKPIGPFAYPYYHVKGTELRQLLRENYIYIPTLWPSVPNITGSVETDYVSNIIALPCDQRYTITDMKRIVGIIRNFN
ncbi:MAG: hypothetical protein WC509_00040 [Candidatus Izemoplasmatales bacterium]